MEAGNDEERIDSNEPATDAGGRSIGKRQLPTLARKHWTSPRNSEDFGVWHGWQPPFAGIGEIPRNRERCRIRW